MIKLREVFISLLTTIHAVSAGADTHTNVRAADELLFNEVKPLETRSESCLSSIYENVQIIILAFTRARLTCQMPLSPLQKLHLLVAALIT